MCMPHACTQYPWGPEEGIGSPGTVVTAVCELESFTYPLGTITTQTRPTVDDHPCKASFLYLWNLKLAWAWSLAVGTCEALGSIIKTTSQSKNLSVIASAANWT